MSRIRTIKPEFWVDEGVAMLSRDARLLYIATWNLADDEGILRWSADFIRSQVFPYDADMTARRIEKLMAELVEGDFLFPYDTGRVRQHLAVVVRFRKHQRINRAQPSKLPPPPLGDPHVREMYGRRDDMTCHLCGSEIVKVTDDWTNTYDIVPGNHYHEQQAQRLHIDHLVPPSKGGADYPSNLASAHAKCNIGRNNRDIPKGSPHYGGDQLTEQDTDDSLTGSMSDSVNDSVTEREREREREREGERESLFDRFWDAYPRHVAREGALKAWTKAALKADTETIIAGAERYRDDPNREAQYTKHPATWLNAGCWEDDPLPASTNAPKPGGPSSNGSAPVLPYLRTERQRIEQKLIEAQRGGDPDLEAEAAAELAALS